MGLHHLRVSPVDECGAVAGVLDRDVLEDLLWLVNEKVKHA